MQLFKKQSEKNKELRIFLTLTVCATFKLSPREGRGLGEKFVHKDQRQLGAAQNRCSEAPKQS